MEILILNWKDINHPQKGGAEVIAHELGKKLIEDGNKVTFFCQTFPGCKDAEEIDGIKIIRKGNQLSVFFHAFLYYRSLKRKPDKIIEMINSICWQTPLYIPRKLRVAYLNQLAREVWFYEFNFLTAVLGYIFESLEYMTYRTTRFICYSESTKKDLVSMKIPVENISLFSIGIDHKKYKAGGKKSDLPLFIFVARLVSMKRADLCIKAMKKLLVLFPKAKLAIIGNGEQEESLIQLAEKLDIKKSVEFVLKNNFFLEKSAKDIKVRLMQKAWCLLLPSVKEGWGMVVTEAAACGTPAIVTDVTGLRDSVLNSKTGIIIPRQSDEAGLASAMIRVCEDSKLRRSLCKNAFEFSKNFTWEKSYQKFKLALKIN